jgi:uncharacterized protein
MEGQRHAFMLFTKAPKPGLTKTRLTLEHGGILTPREAAEFYKIIMLDVADIGFKALEQLNRDARSRAGNGEADTYDFVVCTSPESEVPLMRRILHEACPWPIRYITEQGRNFNERFDHAFKQLWQLGYHSAVSIGGDMPTMPASHIVRAFEWLRYLDATHEAGALVLCPCQACGVSLVGLTEATPMDFEGVFYNQNGVPALDALISLSADRHISLAALDTVADIDDVQDLAHTLSLARLQLYASRFQADVNVPRRLLEWADQMGIVADTPPNDDHDPREVADA